MTAIHTSKKLFATLAAAISLLLILCMLSVPAFAEETAAETTTAVEDTVVAEESGTAEASTAAGTDTSSTTEQNTNEAATTAKSEVTTVDEAAQQAKTRGIINLCVGGAIIILIVILCIVFRAKIPGFAKSVKSELGKITWCTKDQLKKKAIVVIILILALIIVIGLLDFAFSEGIQLLRNITAPLRK